MGRSALAVIRISGPNSRNVIQKMTRSDGNKLDSRKLVFKHIYDPENGEPLDKGLVVWFPGPKSYTGEDSAELHIHGGFAVISSVLKALQKIPGCRMAEAGISLV